MYNMMVSHLMLGAAKNSLTILVESFRQKHIEYDLKEKCSYEN